MILNFPNRLIVPLGGLLAVLLGVAGCPGVFAATLTWDGGGPNNNLGTANNWNPNQAPAAGDLLVFPALNYGAGNTPSSNNLGTLALDGLQFEENGTPFSITGQFSFDGAPGNGATITSTNAGQASLNGGVRQSNSANSVSVNITSTGNVRLGTVTNATGLVKSGAGTGTLFLDSTGNNYAGSTTINAGTLRLGLDNVIPDSSNLILNGGTFHTGGFSETLGTLDVNAGAIINMSGNGTVAFSPSNLVGWSGTLSIWNWDVVGADATPTAMRFGLNGSALTASQLYNIRVYDGAGTGYLGSGDLNSSGFLVLVPEPGAVVAGVVLLGLVGWRERRYFLRVPGAGCRA